MGEAWEGGRMRIVPESSAGEATVAQRAPVEHQAGLGWSAFRLSSPRFRRTVYVEHKLLLVHETVLDDVRSR